MKQRIGLFLCVLFAAGIVLAGQAEKRPAEWAGPMKVEGVPNLHKLNDSLYRSAQPTAEGMKNLEKMGIETVVNLRTFHSDKDEIADLDLDARHIKMLAWGPERDEAVRFLKIVSDPKQQPVLVHCLHGADRTGTMCALYRIAIEGWTKQGAIREMTDGGYGFHDIWVNLPKWIRKQDIAALKKDAGITNAAPVGK